MIENAILPLTRLLVSAVALPVPFTFSGRGKGKAMVVLAHASTRWSGNVALIMAS